MNESGTSSIGIYRVLWTNRKLQKVKYWQDGQLRFHRFNSKAMLYDDSKNLVDQLFISRGFLEVGEEIEFDSVLVSIEEFEKEMLQELSRVVRKKTPAKPLIPERLCRTKSHPKRKPTHQTLETNAHRTSFARHDAEEPVKGKCATKPTHRYDQTSKPHLTSKEGICISDDHEPPTKVVLGESWPTHGFHVQHTLQSSQPEYLEPPTLERKKQSLHGRRNAVLQSLVPNRGPLVKGKEKIQPILISLSAVDLIGSCTTIAPSIPVNTTIGNSLTEVQAWDEADYASDLDLHEVASGNTRAPVDDDNKRTGGLLWDTPEAHDLFSWRPPGR